MTIDYSKLKTSDIKTILIDGGFITEEETQNVKGKAAWVNLHKLLTKVGNVDILSDETEEFDVNLDVDTDGDNDNDNEDDYNELTTYPSYTSIEWPDFVMSNFDEKELHKGNPTVVGLRRVAELLLGRIIESGPVDVRCSLDGSTVGKAVVIYEIIFEWKLGEVAVDVLSDQPFAIRKFRAIASSYADNTDDEFAVFPEAMAETRAEGRALRKALKIHSVCADELTNKDTAELVRQKSEKSSLGEWEADSAITDHQKNVINILCERLEIDVTKFINSGKMSYEKIDDIPRSKAALMITQLNKYQSIGSDSQPIPEHIKL